MLKKTITYKGFDGEQSFTDDFYFNISKAEMIELEVSHAEGMSDWLAKIVAAEDNAVLFEEFKKLVLFAYGERSEDGKRFIKNERAREQFQQTEAFSDLIIELATDTESATQFVNGIMPHGIEAQIEQERLPNRAERRHPSDTAGTPAPAAETNRNVFEKTTPGVEILNEKQVREMDADELKSGLATGRYQIGPRTGLES